MKKQPTEVYKVVVCRPFPSETLQTLPCNGRYYSFHLKANDYHLDKYKRRYKKFLLEYKIGKYTRPKLGSIFCFATKHDAQLFNLSSWPCKIFKALALDVEVPIELTSIPFADGLNYFESYWRYAEYNDFDNRLPPGTLICSALMLVEEVV